ncbi:hypothetical protein [Paenibacillus guangzhouensis]|uniref:hypothetical protein n=1 Tax=Paenibacillus guangzhouensis TaxID=1473112 RepID=UPI001266C568|nr:hypothetical protein [Paenibacillus guangzhouensis]
MNYFEDTISFIRQHILRKDEQIDMNHVIRDSSLIDIDVVKRTARTIRRVGIITMARDGSL